MYSSPRLGLAVARRAAVDGAGVVVARAGEHFAALADGRGLQCVEHVELVHARA